MATDVLFFQRTSQRPHERSRKRERERERERERCRDLIFNHSRCVRGASLVPSFFYPFAPNFRKKFCLSLFLKIKIKNRFYSAREETEEKREKREKREREECDGVQPIRVERSGSCDWKCKEKDRQCDSVTV